MAHPTRIFHEPEEMQKAWEEYKLDLANESKKWIKVQYVGKDGDRVEDNPKVPYTLEGFEIFCRYNYGEVGQYFDNKDKYYTNFVAICRAIRKEIRQDQITGGMLGFYNPSITQRLNGLSENVKQTVVTEQKLLSDDDSDIEEGLELDGDSNNGS